MSGKSKLTPEIIAKVIGLLCISTLSSLLGGTLSIWAWLSSGAGGPKPVLCVLLVMGIASISCGLASQALPGHRRRLLIGMLVGSAIGLLSGSCSILTYEAWVRALFNGGYWCFLETWIVSLSICGALYGSLSVVAYHWLRAEGDSK